MAYIPPPITYPEGDGPPFTLGDTIVVQVNLPPDSAPTETASLSWVVRDPAGVEHDQSANVTFPSAGTLQLGWVADTPGTWRWKLTANGPSTTQVVEDEVEVQDDYAAIANPTDPTDLRVLVPRARRYCEGPYGAPQGKPPLSDQQLYEMCADALGDIILAAGHLWWNQLLVTKRDETRGYPTGWATKKVLSEWESALITTQVALNYFMHLFRDMRTSVTIANEGTNFAYTLSANVLRDYLGQLIQARDAGLEGLAKHHPVMDRFASTMRVRDPATVAILEWWDTNPLDSGGGGMPGGQEAYVVPYIGGDPWGGN